MTTTTAPILEDLLAGEQRRQRVVKNLAAQVASFTALHFDDEIERQMVYTELAEKLLEAVREKG